MKTYHIDLPNHTTIDAIPVDPKGEAGGGDLATVFTEMWAMKNKASQALWSETTLSPLKFGQSIRIGESYAGFRGESPILEPLYETGVKGGQQLDLSFEGHDLRDLEVYRNGRMLTLWNTRPRCPWQTQAYYEQESDVLTPSEMDRMHGNLWADATLAYIPIQWWDDCKVESMQELRSREAVVIGLDAAVNNDCFAVIMVSAYMIDGLKIPQVRYCRVWYPPRGDKIRFSNPGNPEDTDYPEGEIRRLIATYHPEEIAFDATQLEDMANRLGANAYWKKFEQGQPRLIGDKRLYDLIREHRIEHRGEPDLREHLMNADAEVDKQEHQMRIVKRVIEKKIDAAVALSMAVDRVMFYNT